MEPATDFASWSGQLMAQGQSVINFFMFACFMAGIILIGLGIFKLKAAADTQGQQVKYGDGLWRLGIGAALIGLPVIVAITTGSMGFGGENANTASNNLSVTTWTTER